MSDGFSLDLRTAEEEIDVEGYDGQVVLGVLDGSTPGEEWLEEVNAGKVLFLDIVGDLNELAAEFAPEVKESGGKLMRFRGFLVVVPPGVDLDTSRL
ncbi:DUF5779 family protein [Halospeciosus flavus]|uniref:DUF5779 family protein n=1 Tax=Halospeciosus flavus TaxID=3032283 RepID=A0ABD5Z340_9EURY|nr:DUF5779 family protein [Halospeciosus flavus]